MGVMTSARRQRIRQVAVALLVAAAGGALAAAFSMPVAWLLGPLVAIAIASVLGLDTRLPRPFRQIAFFVLGVQAGSGVTPDVVNQFAIWPFSFAIQMAGVLLITGGTYVYLRHLLGWNHETSLFASLPGALAFVVAAAEDTNTDMQRMLIVQTARLLLLIGALTPFLAWLESGGGGGLELARGAGGTVFDYAVLLAVCLASALFGALVRLPGGMMLGALIGSAVLHGTELSSVPVPDVIALPCLVLLGTVIGSRIYGVERRALATLLPVSVICFAIGIAFSALAGLVAVLILPLDPGKVALAYAPGALEALTVLAFQFDVDPAYVAAHHVVRFMAIALIVPFLARSIRRKDRRGGVGEETP
ncbi:AbrB family transcriptional regulator [Fulvimarina sp. 2208YS6-2-32]|uniref:AbrB family transcriptional regulator n=1 Tax=Fulvimarina uroteuthidis TaxID=3098149 RepID=A0ABU5HY76_9HYPH|nr:AbrB family transcriptional regulator [Fulvimarina sp. 2208YS6-2-32]MDY8107529.1 AbrB family transcriptional regulator [Fulvimarina sp. 2208YS6-2-32]